LTVQTVSLEWSGLSEVKGRVEREDLGKGDCTLVPLRCKVPVSLLSASHRNIKPDDTLKLWVAVTVGAGASTP
jgi:hypothetical protein